MTDYTSEGELVSGMPNDLFKDLDVESLTNLPGAPPAEQPVAPQAEQPPAETEPPTPPVSFNQGFVDRAAQALALEAMPSPFYQDHTSIPTYHEKYPKGWKKEDETSFKEWYAGWAQETKINPDPDDPRHYYDYREAYRNGAFPTPDEKGVYHWPSQFKFEDHPNRYVDGIDTKTGQPMDLDQKLRKLQLDEKIPNEHMSWYNSIGHALASGNLKAAETYARSLRLLGVDTTPLLKLITEQQKNYPFSDNKFVSTVQDIISTTMHSWGAGLVGMAAGAALGRSPAAAFLGYAFGAGTLFTLAEVDRFYEEAESYGVERSKVWKQAWLSGATEGIVELLQDLLTGGVSGIFGMKAAAKPWLREGVKAALKRLGAGLGIAIPIESAGEIATDIIQREAALSAGLPREEYTWKDAVYTAIVTSGQTVLTLGLAGTVAHKGINKNADKWQSFILNSYDSIPQFENAMVERYGSIKNYLDEVKKQQEEFAKLPKEEQEKRLAQWKKEDEEARFMPNPENFILSMMGGVAPEMEMEGVERERKERPEEELPRRYFASAEEAHAAGISATEEEVAQWREDVTKLGKEGEWFLETKQRERVSKLIPQVHLYKEAIKAFEKPEEYREEVEAYKAQAVEAVAEAKASESQMQISMDIHGAIVGALEGKKREKFDFDNEEDIALLKERGYNDRDIRFARISAYRGLYKPVKAGKGQLLGELREPTKVVPGALTVDQFKEILAREQAEREALKRPAVGKDYAEASQIASSKQNILVQPSGKPGRVLFAQVSTSATAEGMEPSISTAYFDKLYTKRKGYVRPEDFWELPPWASVLTKSIPDSDVLVVRDPVTAAEQIKKSGYDAVFFSAMEVNKHVIKKIAQLVGPSTRVIVGGYVDKEFFKDTENVEWHDTPQTAVESVGANFVPGSNNKHFRNTPTIPRLCLSKGCLHKCAFCTVEKTITPTSKEGIDDQIENLKGIKFSLVYLDDKTFGQAETYKQLPEIAERIRKFNPDFDGFIVQTTATQFLKLDDDFLNKSNIRFVEFGVESFNDSILAKIHKPAREKQIEEAVEKVRAHKMFFIPNIMVGLTGKGWSETAETYKRTLDFLYKNDDIISHVNVYNLALYAGTELATQLEKREDIDIDENRVERSYHKNVALHESFYKRVLEFASRQLDKVPYQEIGVSEAATRKPGPQESLFREKGKVEVWLQPKGEEVVDEETGEKVKATYLTQEAMDALDKAGVRYGPGPFHPNSNFLVSVTERGGLIYGKARSTDTVTTRTVQTLDGPVKVTERFRRIGGKEFKVLDVPILPRGKAERVKLLDKLVNEFKDEILWYENWRDYMMRFDSATFSPEMIDKMLKIQGILSAGTSPQGAQTAFGKTMSELEERGFVEGGEGKGRTENMALKINRVWRGEDKDIVTLEQYKKFYGKKIGSMIFAALQPAMKEGGVVVDRHIARLWGYNAMWGGGFKVTAATQDEIEGDIRQAAERLGTTASGVQAALWYAAGAGHWGAATHFEDAIRLSPKKSLSPRMMQLLTLEPQAVVSFHGEIHYTLRGAQAARQWTKKERARVEDLTSRRDAFTESGIQPLTVSEERELLDLQAIRDGIKPNSWSRNDVQKRMNAATKDNPHIPLNYWYGSGVRREAYFWGKEPHLTRIYEDEIYDAVTDRLNYTEKAWARVDNDEEVKKGGRDRDQVFMNALASLLQEAGFKGFAIEQGGNTWMLTFDETIVEEHAVTVDVGLSDKVSGLVQLPKKLEDLAKISGNLVAQLEQYVTKLLKDYPVTIESVRPTLARITDSTGGETEYGLSLKLKGPITAIRAALSHFGLSKRQTSVIIFTGQGRDGRLIRFEFDEQDLGKIGKILKKNKITDFNIVRDKGKWIFETFFFGDDENIKDRVDPILDMFEKSGKEGTLEQTFVGSEILSSENMSDVEAVPTDYKHHILNYYGKNKGENVYGKTRNQGDEWAATSALLFGTEAAKAGMSGQTDGEKRGIRDQFREPERPEPESEANIYISGGEKFDQFHRQLIDTGARPSAALRLRNFLYTVERSYPGLVSKIKSITHARLKGQHGLTTGSSIQLDTLDEVTLAHEIAEVLNPPKGVGRGAVIEDQGREDLADAIAQLLLRTSLDKGVKSKNILNKRSETRIPDAEKLLSQFTYENQNLVPLLKQSGKDDVIVDTIEGGQEIVPVLVNPSTIKLRGLINRADFHSVRIMVGPDGTLYAWDAARAIHGQIADFYGFQLHKAVLTTELNEYNSGTVVPFLNQYLTENFPESAASLVGPHDAAQSTLAKAQLMEQSGKFNEDQIFFETGWVRGPDNLWMFWVDDSKATSRAKFEQFCLEVWKGIRDKAEAPVTIFKMSEVFNHSKLYKLYPQLKDINVIFKPYMTGWGEYRESENTIYISGLNFTKDSLKLGRLKRTLLHEIQHAIASIEGWPLGTSMEYELERAKVEVPGFTKWPKETQEDYLNDRVLKNGGEAVAHASEAMLERYRDQVKKGVSPALAVRTVMAAQPFVEVEDLIAGRRGTWINYYDRNSAIAVKMDSLFPTRNLQQYVNGIDRFSDLGNVVREALRVSGLDQYKELLRNVDMLFQPYVKLDPKAPRNRKSLEAHARKRGISVAEMERQLEKEGWFVDGVTTTIPNIFHAVVQISYAMNTARPDRMRNLFHEYWHLIERLLIPKELLAKFEKLEDNSENRADKFADSCLQKLGIKEQPSWLTELFDKIKRFFWHLRHNLASIEITDPEQIFEMARKGFFRPEMKRRLVHMKSGAEASEIFVNELQDIYVGEANIVSDADPEMFTIDNEATGKARVKELVDNWMGFEPESQMSILDTSDIPGPARADSPADDTMKAVELPELLEIYRLLMDGKLPTVREKLFGKDSIRGVFIPRTGATRLRAANFTDPMLAARVLGHEMGHLIDWLPDHVIKGTMLGKIASIKDFIKEFLPFKPGAPGELTEADIKRLREEAVKLLGMKQELRTKYIDTTLTETYDITPEDVLRIWRDLDGSFKKNHPELYKYIAGLDSAAKKAIVIQALKGFLAPELEAFKNVIKLGPKLRKEVTEVIYKAPTQAEIMEKLRELIAKEVKIRKLWVEEEVRDELKQLSLIWRPFVPELATKAYIDYRWSSDELYADAVSALFADPKFLRMKAPKFYEAFFNYLDAKPAVKEVYLEIQRQISAGEVDRNRTERFYKMMDDGNVAFGKQYKDYGPGTRGKLAQAFLDRFHFIIKDVRKVNAATGLEAVDNPEYKLEEMMYTGSEHEGFVTDVYRNVIKPLENANLKWDREFGLFMMLKRIAFELPGQAAPGGFDVQKAIEKMNAMRDKELTPTQWEALKTAAKNFRKIHEEYFINKAEKAEVYDEEMIKKFRDNTEYVTFNVLPYLIQRYGTAVATKIWHKVGAVQDIANPATSTVMKDMAFMSAVNRNEAIKTVVKFYQDYSNITGVQVKPAKKKWNGRFQEIQEPVNNREEGLVVYLSKGKAYGFYLPKEIADSINEVNTKHLMTARIFRGLSTPFRKVFTELNYGFWMFNAFFRDAQRLVMALPGYRVDKFVKHWLSGLKPAFKSVFGIHDDVVHQMQKDHMLISIGDFRGLNDEEEQMERLVKIYQMKPPKEFHSSIMKPFGHLFNYISNRARLAEYYFTGVGRALERTTKVAAYTYLKEKFPDMPTEVVGHIVRTRGGSPDFLRAGKEQQLYNNILMFSNAIKEGYRGDWEAFKDNPGQFFIKKLVAVILPKLLMYGALIGLLGRAFEDIFDGVSEYDLTNYLIIPLGRTKSGKSVYWRVPTDETSRFLGGVLWKLLGLKELGTGVRVADLADYLAGQAPTISPGISMIADVIEYASGKNPYDSFYGRHAMGDLEFKAGDNRARIQFLKYLIQKAGASIVYKFKHDKVDKVAEELESVLGFPISSPVGDFALTTPNLPIISNLLGRFLKVSDYGVREKLLQGKEQIQRDNARILLDAREGIYAIVDGEPITNEQLLALMQKPDVAKRQLMLSLARKYGWVYYEEWLAAGSKAEKAYIIRRMLEKIALSNQESAPAPIAPPREGTPEAAAPLPELPPLSYKDLVEKETKQP